MKELMPVITSNQGKGVMNGLFFDAQNKERVLQYDGVKLTCRHYFTLPWDPRATDGSICPRVGCCSTPSKDEFLIAGNGIVVEFEKADVHSQTINTKLEKTGLLIREEIMRNKTPLERRKPCWHRNG